MYTFTTAKRDGKWVIVAVLWDDIEAYYDFDDFANDLNINSNELKTELIRKWKGSVGDETVEFDSQKYADNAIKNYMDGLLTAAALCKK